VKVAITNGGGTEIPKGGKASVKVYARPIDAVDASQDVLLGEKLVPVAKLGAGETTKAKKVSLAFAQDLPEDEYRLVAVVDADSAVPETDENNNTATLDEPHIDIAAAFVDLGVEEASTNLPASIEAGKKGKATVVIAHGGNVPLNGEVKIEIFATPNGQIDGDAIAIGGTPGVAIKLRPGASKSFNLNIVAPEVEEASDLQIVARITPLGDIPDNNLTNHEGALGTVQVRPGPPSLASFVGAVTFNELTSNPITGTQGSFTSSTGAAGPYFYQWSIFGRPNEATLHLETDLFPSAPTGADTDLFIRLIYDGSRVTSFDGKTIRFTAASTGNTLGAYEFAGWGDVPANRFPDGFFELVDAS
jgi:hypothetical protein